MDTHQLYYDDPQQQEFTSTIVDVAHVRGNTYVVELAETAFFPEGGGQPSDQGTIASQRGELTVKLVRAQGGRILHEGTAVGPLEPGDEVVGRVKWPRRLKYMRIHSAGHLIHDVLTDIGNGLVPIKGRHGDKAFLEYRGQIEPATAERLEQAVNEAVREDMPIKTWESSREELEALQATLPPNLPDKALRAIRIGAYTPMADGGVHVATTGEIGEVVIHHINSEDGSTTIRYGVRGPGGDGAGS